MRKALRKTSQRSSVAMPEFVLPFMFLLVLQLMFNVALSDDVFFDKYGDCMRDGPFDLTSDVYQLHSVGGGFKHETMYCKMGFKAPPENGICLNFHKFSIEDCVVSLVILRGKSEESTQEWKKFNCKDEGPKQMCTADQHLQVEVRKERLNRNKGYYFEISVEKSSSVTEGGVLFASLGLVIGIIVAVLILIAIGAFLIIYCCRRHHTGDDSCPNKPGSYGEPNAEPSAPPPPPDMNAPFIPHAVPMYPTLEGCSHQDLPPPYTEHESLTAEKQNLS